MILSYAINNGCFQCERQQALSLFHDMQIKLTIFNSYLFTLILKADCMHIFVEHARKTEWNPGRTCLCSSHRHYKMIYLCGTFNDLIWFAQRQWNSDVLPVHMVTMVLKSNIIIILSTAYNFNDFGIQLNFYHNAFM